ncbi:hypothetical protein HNQ94_001128 [Salirhabdus euzebyi]|uniref:Uncharacterized protein n=1 Tax=Salirhabdus euzebyi TaxID=394506 RepID=A0A841Q2C7_9BACI|nr:hypothetical protein [Salirhabdus euzebyi]MBB6452682.1 hypothetical protein [Salirhabdus euzebyi]
MNKKILYAVGSIIPLLIGGYFLFQNLSGNSDAMLKYVEDTNVFTDKFNALIDQEATVADEELLDFTENTLIPGLEALLIETKAYGNDIKEEKLKEIHDIDNESLQKYIEAEKAWLAGNDEQSNALYAESDELAMQYEEELNALATKWAVDIEWE